MWRFLPLIFFLNALTVDDGGARAGFSVGQLTTLYIERVMDAIERAIQRPQVKIVVHRAARRQVLRNRSPLATGAQHIHQAIDHLAHIDRALVAASLGWQQSTAAPVPILHRSNRSDSVAGFGRNDRGSSSSTSAPLQIGPPPLNHK
jgi:hypothetical protein